MLLFSNISKDKFIAAYNKSTTIFGLCKELGLTWSSMHGDQIRMVIIDLKLDRTKLSGFIPKRKYTDQDLLQKIDDFKKGMTIKRFIQGFGYKYTRGTAYRVVVDLARLGYRFQYTHPNGCTQKRGAVIDPSAAFQEGTNYKSYVLKEIIYKHKLMERKCAYCQADSWNNASVILELNHKNGNKFDNQLINLELLCPNCHSQTPSFANNKRGVDWSLPSLTRCIEDSWSKSEILKKLGSPTHRETILKLEYLARYYKISLPECRAYLAPNDILTLLVEHGRCKSNHLKHRLFQEQMLIPQCSVCGITDHNNKPLMFVLDHKNGIRNDNRLENLRIICFNCDSQSDTYKGRNRKRTKETLPNKYANQMPPKQSSLIYAEPIPRS